MADSVDSLSPSDSSDSVNATCSTGRNKRRKVKAGRSHLVGDRTSAPLSFTPLLDLLAHERSQTADDSFEKFFEVLLPEYLRERAIIQEKESEVDEFTGQTLRPLTPYETSSFIDKIHSVGLSGLSLVDEAVFLRKLKLQRERRRVGLPEVFMKDSYEGPVNLLPSVRPSPAVNSQVIDALYSIKTTPYECSFLSRLSGEVQAQTHEVVSVDWETVSPWMKLMNDIRGHYGIVHSEREQFREIPAPITYVSLQPCHLDQVHDLFSRVFWGGINVGDSLQYCPEQSTVVATYKRLVVGAAILSSPQETYITYLAVKAGWENSQIATTMLYHLITSNPNKDITLHVSANNSAMLLYNRFGFKAEGFVAGFYEDYVDPRSRASKNAFRLRLRR